MQREDCAFDENPFIPIGIFLLPSFFSPTLLFLTHLLFDFSLLLCFLCILLRIQQLNIWSLFATVAKITDTPHTWQEAAISRFSLSVSLALSLILAVFDRIDPFSNIELVLTPTLVSNNPQRYPTLPVHPTHNSALFFYFYLCFSPPLLSCHFVRVSALLLFLFPLYYERAIWAKPGRKCYRKEDAPSSFHSFDPR